MKNNIINHIAFVIDKSGSIKLKKLERPIIELFDDQIKHWSLRSKELDQEVRVSVYLFNQEIECLFFDVDISKIPSLLKFYRADGDTAMIDAMFTAINDLKEINTKYGDHSFLIQALTDGENRINNHLANKLNKEINGLPEEWTVGALVPDANGVFECKKFGFPKNNIQVWEQSSAGVQEVGETMKKATMNYLSSRSAGIKGLKNLYSIDASNLNTKEVKRNLDELSVDEYELLPVRQESYIKPFVEDWMGGSYRVGSGYYELMKIETIQASKNVCIVDKITGKVYTGLNARNLLKLPNYEIKVNPLNYGKYKIFVQSTSTNRKLLKGTQLLVLK